MVKLLGAATVSTQVNLQKYPGFCLPGVPPKKYAVHGRAIINACCIHKKTQILPFNLSTIQMLPGSIPGHGLPCFLQGYS